MFKNKQKKERKETRPCTVLVTIYNTSAPNNKKSRGNTTDSSFKASSRGLTRVGEESA
jgi:hypothetical protein